MPRVGRKRELKFATEKFWRQEITASELLNIAADVVDDIYNCLLYTSDAADDP